MRLLDLFCQVDAFCHGFEPTCDADLRAHGTPVRRRAAQLALSEVMTILMYVHQLRFPAFKTYYVAYVRGHRRRELPHAVSDQRFVELLPATVDPRCASLQTCVGRWSGRSFVASTPLAGCHHRRIPQHRVFRGIAQRGKTALRGFYGVTLHVVINHRGELLACQLTRGNVAARRPVRNLAERVWGRLFGDTGYRAQPLTRTLLHARRVRRVTHRKRNMANRLLLLRTRSSCAAVRSWKGWLINASISCTSRIPVIGVRRTSRSSWWLGWWRTATNRRSPPSIGTVGHN